MEDILSISLFISIVYLIIRFIEMNFVDKEPKPIKLIIKDTFFVFIAINLGNFLITQIFGSSNITGGANKTSGNAVDAFTGDPEF
jgi:uncharacterized membrane protein (DUF373 family)